MSLFDKLKKKQTVFNRLKKEKAPVGYTTDAEIIEALGLVPGKGVLVKAQLRNVVEAQVNDTDVVRFTFIIQSGKGKGLPVDETLWFSEEQFEDSLKTLIFMLQKLGYDTSGISGDDLNQLISELTEEKPYCKIFINCYKVKRGPNKGNIKKGLRVNSPWDPNDEPIDGTSEDDNPEDTDETEEEDSVQESNGEDEGESDQSGDEGPASEDESDEGSSADDATSEEEEGPDEDDPSTWIGYSVRAQPAGATKPGVFEVVKFLKKTNTLVLKSKMGKEVKTTPDKVVDWA